MITKEKLVKWIMEEEGLEVGQKFKINKYNTFYINDDYNLVNKCGIERDVIGYMLGQSITKLKDPYKDWLTVEDIKELGIKIERGQKVLVCDSVNFASAKMHYCNTSDEFFQCWCEGKTSWSTNILVCWKYIKLVK